MLTQTADYRDSGVLTLNSGRAYELAGKVKVLDPESKIVFGGYIQQSFLKKRCSGKALMLL